MKIAWSSLAQQDINELFDHILEDNPAAAWAIFERIMEQIEALATHPNRGRPGRVPGTRELVITQTRYIVPYRVANDSLQILRIYHSARRWPDTFDV